MTVIFHIIKADEWKQAQSTGLYRADTLDTQGFINCSTSKQIVNVANALFRDQKGLLLLCIDSEKLGSKLRFDILPANGEVYPRINGPINIDAVVLTLPFESSADGSFSLPKEFDDFMRSSLSS